MKAAGEFSGLCGGKGFCCDRLELLAVLLNLHEVGTYR